MAKIRGVKPDLWTDEDFVELSPYARLLWIGLWNYACDNGHLADKSKQIKMRVLPTDEVNCAELLREIAGQGLIERADGWITIPNLTRHQKVDRRYFTTCEKEGCDEPPETVSQRATRRAHGGHTAGAQGVHAGGTAGALGDGEVMVKGSDGDSTAAGKPRAKKASQLPADWQPSESHHRLAAERMVNLSEEADKFRDWCAANGATKKDWEATFRNWLRNARPTSNVHQLTRTDDQGRTILPPLPPKTPWGPA